MKPLIIFNWVTTLAGVLMLLIGGVSCVSKPPVAVVVPRALPVEQVKANVSASGDAVEVVRVGVKDLTESSNNLKRVLDDAQESQADVKERVDDAFDLGLEAGSVEAGNLRQAVSDMSDDLKAAEVYGFKIAERLVLSERDLKLVDDELERVQVAIERMDVERDELRAVAGEQERQLAVLTESNIDQLMEVRVLKISRNRWRLWAVLLGVVAVAYVAVRLGFRGV